MPRLQKVKSALEELAELRKSGAKRVDRFELKEEDAVYDVVDETEYVKLVQKRREEGGAWLGFRGVTISLQQRGCARVKRRDLLAALLPDCCCRWLPPPAASALNSLCPRPAGGFVIDEEGLGYADVGEEIDWGAAEEETEPAGGAEGKPGGKTAGAKRKAAAEPVPGARVRMQKMFQTAQAKAKPKVAVDDASADALLDDILGGLDGGARSGSASR